jgi:hypothetical protein
MQPIFRPALAGNAADVRTLAAIHGLESHPGHA